jgi:hypothetical protein
VKIKFKFEKKRLSLLLLIFYSSILFFGDYAMTIAIGKSEQKRGWFDQVDDWLSRDRFVFVGWSRSFIYSHVHILHLVVGLLEQHLLLLVYTWINKILFRRL